MKTYVYIDGFNLYHGCVKLTAYKWLNLIKLSESLLGNAHQVERVKFFTAKVAESPNDPDQPNRQMIYWRALRTLKNLDIIEGMFYESTRSMPIAKDCKLYDPDQITLIRVLKREEKGSDVNLASHLLMDGFEKRYEQAVVITNDSDLATPVSIVRKHLKLPVGIINPHEHHSVELKPLASFLGRIRQSDLAASQFPSELQDAKGKFQRPARWAQAPPQTTHKFKFTKWGRTHLK